MRFLIFTVVPGIISFFVMRNEKSTLSKEEVDESPLSGKVLWYVFILCLLIPLIAQTIFYYGWKNRLPQKAKKANILGWLAILIWFIAIIMLL